MIIAKTPLRMSFAGGGSDMRSFYKDQPGAVLSTAIDKYIYVSVNPNFDEGIKLKYSEIEKAAHMDELRHTRAREILRHHNLPNGLEITSTADIPSEGSGLGSSSSFTVALLHALYGHRKLDASPEQLGAEASRIEIDVLGEPIGKQDQYAAAYGGLKLIEFHPDESVTVTPVSISDQAKQGLEDNLMVFYTGITRSASNILQHQKQNLAQVDKKAIMRQMVQLAHDLKAELEKDNIEAMGQILHENWLLKREMAPGISNQQIDDWYAAARQAGAIGGKLLGAGGGGFLLFFVPKEKQEAVKKALRDLRPFPVSFDDQGSRIVVM
jgi:D-glycero-alpha-D-manno-heptose-7-phosphate kinase